MHYNHTDPEEIESIYGESDPRDWSGRCDNCHEEVDYFEGNFGDLHCPECGAVNETL